MVFERLLADPSFRRGLREGARDFMPLAVGLLPWAVVTGIAMRSVGMSELEAIGMNLIVFAGTAQLGTLPLIASGAPVWLLFVTALALNLRFIIFSASIAPLFAGRSRLQKLAASYLLVDGVFAICAGKAIHASDAQWRWGYYLAPSVLCWLLWQCCGLIGILGAELVPAGWSLEFMVTIALMVLLLPMVQDWPLLVAALVAGLGAVALRGLPLRLGVVAAIVLGMIAGVLVERRRGRAQEDKGAGQA